MQLMIDLSNPTPQQEEEKAWENPAEPANASDSRDKEQLQRQYEEAKRRKDNLTTDDNEKEKQTD